jgi:hypothetical protein
MGAAPGGISTHRARGRVLCLLGPRRSLVTSCPDLTAHPLHLSCSSQKPGKNLDEHDTQAVVSF